MSNIWLSHCASMEVNRLVAGVRLNVSSPNKRWIYCLWRYKKLIRLKTIARRQIRSSRLSIDWCSALSCKQIRRHYASDQIKISIIADDKRLQHASNYKASRHWIITSRRRARCSFYSRLICKRQRKKTKIARNITSQS